MVLDLFSMIFMVALFAVFFLWRRHNRARPSAFDVEKALSETRDPDIAKIILERIAENKRTQFQGETLTKFELQLMLWRLKQDIPACIDCERGELLTGPSTGINVNVKCSNANCGSMFNICLYGLPMSFDRISDRSPNRPLDMTSFGPHR